MKVGPKPGCRVQLAKAWVSFLALGPKLPGSHLLLLPPSSLALSLPFLLIRVLLPFPSVLVPGLALS